MGKTDLGNHLKELRRNFGLTQKQVALALHIDRSTYSYYELGKTWPDPPTLVQLANIFGIEILELVSSEEDKTMMWFSESETMDFGRGNRNSKNMPFLTNTSKIYDLPEDEQQLLLYYRTLNAKQKNELLKQAEKVSEKTVKQQYSIEE